ncbi:hypothetical protein [Staphylococcus capitis]|uniref:hypothetical protein n=1 Tax=Staphylococcus capitis TaxID=29388 RepID=UPI0028796E90|nr:hypothetical protein [Staphylococcus capitis]MDS3991647.1 hypothetical protein [Staphylococcus capitis]MDS3999114.1 hypothetical protein [Staphylococcus capitis]
MAELHFGSKEYFEKQSEFWFEENSKRISERDAYKKQRDELINDMAEVKKKAEAFDGINKLKDNIKFIKDVSLSHANEEPVNQEMYWVHSLMDSLLEGLEVNHER